MVLAPIYSTEEVRALERTAPLEPGSPTLMQRAGLAAAEHAMQVMSERSRGVLVLAGPGNNGGDAFELAAHLKQHFFRVDVLSCADSGRLSADANAALARWRASGGREMTEFPADVAQYGLIVDGLFGIGLQRPLEGRYAALIESMNASGIPVLALDLPSGLHADTGAIMGIAVRARHTVTFIALKPGLLTLDGPDCCGRVEVASLGLDVRSLCAPSGQLLSQAVVAQALRRRPKNFHKGDAGNVAVLGGAAGMVGAALLAGRAALRCGAGRVYLGLLDEHTLSVDPSQPELMLRSCAQVPLDDAVIAAGPGMGRSPEAKAALERALASDSPLVLDADALNLIAAEESLAARTQSRSAATVLTPHPAEAARLLGRKTGEVQSDRLAAARAIAQKYRALVALKGNGTVIAGPLGRWWINPSGHPGMASAGMGDALTGIVAALLAQGAEPSRALTCGVWLHGAAGDAAASLHQGELGTTASDVIEQLRAVLNRHSA